MNQSIITVFTPLYNRKDLVRRLYNSLVAQTCYDFEWIICDDCSTDGSWEFVQELAKNEDRFDVKLCRTSQNGGKHRAINCGMQYAAGFMFFIVDSDDVLTSDAIEKILQWEETIQGKDRFAGVAFLRAGLAYETIGTSFQEQFLDCTSLERDKNDILGDKAEVFYTELLRAYPFPEFEGEKFLSEAVVWDRIAHDGYQIRWINEIIYLCEYQTDGLSANWNRNLLNSINGYTEFIRQRIHFSDQPAFEKFLIVEAYYSNVHTRGYSLHWVCEKLDYPFLLYAGYYPIFKLKQFHGKLKQILHV